jgi:hypothetical protein
MMESLLGALVGLGLAASCGFRVFVPLLVASVATRAGLVEPAEGFAWLGSWPAIIALAVATLVEVGAYYVPWLDNLLDTIASPAAAVAGTVLFAALVTDFDPFLQWSLAIIAGGGAAAVVQGGTVATRAASTTTTGGTANFLINTAETASGFFFSILSIALPILAIALLAAVCAILYYIGRKVVRRFFSRRASGWRIK